MLRSTDYLLVESAVDDEFEAHIGAKHAGNLRFGPFSSMEEQRTFNPLVQGSSP